MGLKGVAKPVVAKISDLASAFLTVRNDRMYEEVMHMGQEINNILYNKENAAIRINNIKFNLNRLISAYELLGPEKIINVLQEIIDGVDKIEKELNV